MVVVEEFVSNSAANKDNSASTNVDTFSPESSSTASSTAKAPIITSEVVNEAKSMINNSNDELYLDIARCYELVQCGSVIALNRLLELSTGGENLASGFYMLLLYQGMDGVAAKNEDEAQRLAGDIIFWLINACDEKSHQFRRGVLPFAQYILAMCYFYGLGLNKDTARCFKLMSSSASMGYVVAIHTLGNAYCRSTSEDFGITKDNAEAIRLYRQAAEMKYAPAQYSLASSCYSQGLGVAKSEDEAAKLYALAAEQGHIKAQHELAVNEQTKASVVLNEPLLGPLNDSRTMEFKTLTTYLDKTADTVKAIRDDEVPVFCQAVLN